MRGVSRSIVVYDIRAYEPMLHGRNERGGKSPVAGLPSKVWVLLFLLFYTKMGGGASISVICVCMSYVM